MPYSKINKNSIDVASMQHDIIGASKFEIQNFVYNPHPDAKWFINGGNLGLFIHYGISTVNAKVDISWGMMANKPWEIKMGEDLSIMPKEYFKLAENFKPDNYNPNKWVRAIAEAGFTYAVFTTRHHDGFAMWPSNFGDFNTKNYLDGYDFVKLFIEACRKYNIKVGLYYSPPDWYYNREYMSFNYGSVQGSNALSFEGREHFDVNHKPIVLPKKPNGWEDNFTKYVSNQIKELITNYGRIDMLWFDGSIEQYEKVISIDEIRSIQPWIIVNPRLHHKGDFETFECRMPEKKPNCVWEHEVIWADGPWWAYMEQSKGYRSAKWAMDLYKNVKKWNGNLLINVAPRADGSLPKEVYEKLKDINNGKKV
jgi:alpha-L-fucosidase